VTLATTHAVDARCAPLPATGPPPVCLVLRCGEASEFGDTCHLRNVAYPAQTT